MNALTPNDTLLWALAGVFGTSIFAVFLFIEHMRRAHQAQVRALQASADVADAALGQYDVRETLGRILERAAGDLEAQGGAVFLEDPTTGDLTLVRAKGVEHFGNLAHVSLGDPLVRQLLVEPDTVQTRTRLEHPWADLLPPRSGHPGGGALAAISVGLSDRAGVLALAWQSAGAMEALSDVLGIIRRQTRLALGEFEGRDQRLAEFHALSERQEHYRALMETGLHDLNNSLQNFRPRLEMWQAGVLPADPEQLRLLVDLAQGMEADLKTLRSPGNLCPDLQDISIGKLLELIPGMAELKLRARRVDFRIELEPGLPPVAGDRLMLMRVLDNLLTNAGKYNRKDGTGWVRLRVTRAGHQIRFEVEDNGIGIPPDDLPHLFQLRQRASNTGAIKGHGYGLWSCERIVGAHGGRIWVDSHLGVGSTFIFTIPAVLSAPGGADLPPAPAPEWPAGLARPWPQEAI